MSTTSQALKYLWTAVFDDSHFIVQPADDRYSGHDEEAEHNPSAFRDLLDYQKQGHRLTVFELGNYEIDLVNGDFYVNDRLGAIGKFSLEEVPLEDRKLIYFREMRQEWIDGVPQEPYVNRYCVGYEGKDPEGKIQKKVVYIDG